jgi:adenosylcobinamide-phosphate synthase
MHSDLTVALGILATALLVDRLLGEYPRAFHPVIGVGKIIAAVLRLAPRRGWYAQFFFGAVLAIVPVALGVGLAWLAMFLTEGVPALQIFVGAYLLKASLALRELGQAAERVRAAVEKNDLESARLALRALCSRDPSTLSAEELLGAAIQSVAENLSDSVVAPLFFYLLLGVPGAVGYRVVNTLDAMVGYRGEYEALGKVSARLDDVLNWVPARLTSGLMLLVGFFMGKKIGDGWRILRRDGAKTPSPNGGRPMAMMAGLLRVSLEKKQVYALGDASGPVTPGKVTEAWRLAAGSAWLAAALCGLGIAGWYYHN